MEKGEDPGLDIQNLNPETIISYQVNPELSVKNLQNYSSGIFIPSNLIGYDKYGNPMYRDKGLIYRLLI